MLIKRSKERKVMEKLKTRQNQAWRAHLDKKEAAMLDEIAVIFHER
jgi:flagellar FliJ protein